MNEYAGKTPDEDTPFTRLMKKLIGQPIELPEEAGRKVIRRDEDPLSIVEVTEELLRRLKK